MVDRQTTVSPPPDQDPLIRLTRRPRNISFRNDHHHISESHHDHLRKFEPLTVSDHPPSRIHSPPVSEISSPPPMRAPVGRRPRMNALGHLDKPNLADLILTEEDELDLDVTSIRLQENATPPLSPP
ncbi:hypothetical protein BCR33DRAFT_716754 [Rhizoclosmatium globosum]|uniref:Uncharacterized protein n=1 Tax=Rhizoclosmatium globosum TaxID=329046 RepID=A0A1Y2CD28_9FUNG|nr:hypothetical protein BCR33DRAFT_716754 [Rhizoclosmatium globosum]|eukprot:ORY44807.1 hypothetical protein BCR33DRAFT_716754 [Rhizoclosmatium globosum]